MTIRIFAQVVMQLSGVVFIYFVLTVKSFTTKDFYVSFLVIPVRGKKCKGKEARGSCRDMQSDFLPRLWLW